MTKANPLFKAQNDRIFFFHAPADLGDHEKGPGPEGERRGPGCLSSSLSVEYVESREARSSELCWKADWRGTSKYGRLLATFASALGGIGAESSTTLRFETLLLSSSASNFGDRKDMMSRLASAHYHDESVNTIDRSEEQQRMTS